jgi:uncharacterized protein with von Willebrand factor type A (vWA) domain
MNAFPLALFLASLESDGIRPTLHDYDRISIALRTSCPWTVTQLRGVLLALLVKDEEGEATFLHHFQDFFSPAPEAEVAFSNVNVEQVLSDLRELAHSDIQSHPMELAPRSRREIRTDGDSPRALLAQGFAAPEQQEPSPQASQGESTELDSPATAEIS